MTINGPPVRVMVSSVMEDFGEFRDAARRGIVAAGGEPVMAEDWPSLPTSPRNACLDAVESADVYVGIVGERGGWIAPSGKLVVEEEFERAKDINLPAIVFLQECERDEEGDRLARRLSDYVDGTFRQTFTTPSDLEAKVADALGSLIDTTGLPAMDTSQIKLELTSAEPIADHTTLRVVVAPQRSEEVISPVELGNEEFVDLVMGIGHGPGVRLLHHNYAKKTDLLPDSIRITQGLDQLRSQPVQAVRLEIASNGTITTDLNVTGRVKRGDDYGFADTAQVVEGDIVEALQQSFGFVQALYDGIDRYERHQTFLYGAALTGLGHRTLVAEFIQRSGYTMAMSNPERLLAEGEPRSLSRQRLAAPTDEITRVVTSFRRQLHSRTD